MQKPGKSGRHRGVVNMSGDDGAEPFRYRRPVGAELTLDMPMTLSADPSHSLYVKQWTYKGKTVDFALTQRFEESAGEYEHVMRYDCCHSEVHKHQYRRGGIEAARTRIVLIDDAQTSWERIDSAYDESYDDAIDNWNEYFRRWNS